MASPRRELVPADEDEMNGLMDEDIKALEHSRSKLRRQLGFCALVVLAGVGIVLHGSLSEAASPATLRLATWNIAAINNNPFEYWITHSDPDYNTLMADVQARPQRACVHSLYCQTAHRRTATLILSRRTRPAACVRFGVHLEPASQAFVDAPAERDVPVEEVFSESRWQERIGAQCCRAVGGRSRLSV